MNYLSCKERMELRKMLEYIGSMVWNQHQYFNASESVCSCIEEMLFDQQQKLKQLEESTKTQYELKVE